MKIIGIFLRCSAKFVYQHTFPDRQAPSQQYFLRLYRKLRNNENSFTKVRRKKLFIIDEETERNVLAHFVAYPEISIRNCARELEVKRATVHAILKKNKFHPYKMNKVQTLLAGDEERRLQ